MGSESLLKPVLTALSAILKPRGYVKSGSTFRLRNSDTVCIISLQSSTSSTSALAKVRVNLGVHVPALQDPDRPEETPSAWSTHWHERIGHLLPEKNDVWWFIHSVEEGSAIATETVGCMERFGLPALAQVSTVPALRRLWESGRSPGLTEAQRVRFLQQLEEAAAQ
jgi:Domain of unknown function (DUF4304)